MKKKIFLEHYRLCQEDGAPVELSRGQDLVGYKAIDTRFDEPVTVKRLPVADVDPVAQKELEKQARAARVLDHVHIAKLLGFGIEENYFVFVSEYLAGDTLDTWVAEHGPVPPEAVLRVGLQVLGAVGAAGFHGLTHREITPSNLVIVPGEVAEGGWPFVKLMNFGVAGLKLEPDNGADSSSDSPFASPEQWQLGIADFRSEVYSLGATMCFLLSGVMASRDERLQQIKDFPKPIRNLLTPMLRDNPVDRPQDPIVLAEAIRECLTSVARREELARKFAIPIIPAFRNRRERSPVWLPRRSLAIAALVLMLTVLAGVLWPQNVGMLFHKKTVAEPIGVPIGVADASTVSRQPVPAPSAAPKQTAAPALVSTNQPASQDSPVPETANTAVPAMSVAPANNEIASNDRKPEPEPVPPAAGPGESEAVDSSAQEDRSARSENAEGNSPTANVASESSIENERQPRLAESVAPKLPTKPKTVASLNRRSTVAPRRTRLGRTQGQLEDASALAPGTFRARVIATTPNGNVILRLPSGETAIAGPAPRRSHRSVERRERFSPPLQPFDPESQAGD
jgi:serine/threonine protein kinase